MTDAGERARLKAGATHTCEQFDEVCAERDALETANAELRADADRQAELHTLWKGKAEDLKAEVERLRKEQDRLYTEVNLTNVRLAEENTRLRAATSAEAVKVVEALRLAVPYVIGGWDDSGCWCDLHDPQKSQWEKPCTGCRVRAALAAYDRAQAQKDQGEQ